MNPYRGPLMTLGKRLEAGETQRSGARSYNVSRATISRLTAYDDGEQRSGKNIKYT